MIHKSMMMNDEGGGNCMILLWTVYFRCVGFAYLTTQCLFL